MIDKKKARLYIKFIILILCLVIIVHIFSLTLSRYESESESNADIDIAFYVLNEDYQSMTLNLGKIVPRAEPYIYNFTISNEKDGKIAETDIEYELTLRMTTNLPLEYNLYMNEEDTSTKINTEGIEENIIQDEDGTYFKTLTKNKQEFKYSVSTLNKYTLVVYFPEEYNTEDYQDRIDIVEINVDAKQIIDEP